jgi:hypothetical protein
MKTLITELNGKAMWTCRRAADMATFQFGERIQVKTRSGQPAEVGEYARHVQCDWRVVNGDSVFVGSRDLYYPPNHREGDDIPGDFNWDRGPNRRDELLRSLFGDGTKTFIVRSINLGKAGACVIEFEGDIALEIFPDDSSLHEHWRLFATQDSKRELVIGGRRNE